MRRVAIIFVLVVFASIFTLATSSTPVLGEKAEFVLKFAHVQPEKHPTTSAVRWMAKELMRRTNGRVTVEVYPGGQLGTPDEMLDQLSTGDLDMAWVSNAQLARWFSPLSFLSVSYLVKNWDHYRRLVGLGSPFMKELESTVAKGKKDFQFVAVYGGATRRLYNSVRPVKTVEDLKGLKVRVQKSPVELKVWSKLGTLPVPLAWSEIYTALQTKVADGAESSTSSYYTNRFYEVAPYHSLTDHQWFFLMVLMSAKTLEKLPADLRKTVVQVAGESGDWCQNYWKKETDKVIEKLKKAGVTVTEVDLKPFIDLLTPLHDEVAKQYGAEKLLRLIRETL